MSENTVNDNEAHGGQHTSLPDAHGQAAMLLVESLIHGLIERSVISVADAIEIVTIAADVKIEIGAEMGDTPDTMHRSLALLDAVGRSLATD